MEKISLKNITFQVKFFSPRSFVNTELILQKNVFPFRSISMRNFTKQNFHLGDDGRGKLWNFKEESWHFLENEPSQELHSSPSRSLPRLKFCMAKFPLQVKYFMKFGHNEKTFFCTTHLVLIKFQDQKTFLQFNINSQGTFLK